MPELPEVETVRRDLAREVVGRAVKAVAVTGTRSVRRQQKDVFVERLVGRTITGTVRRGKYLALVLDDGSWLVAHLRMSGQLLLADDPEQPQPKHTHVTITFASGDQLRFVDPRTFGEMFVMQPDELATGAPEIGALGFDPVESLVSWLEFGRLLLGRNQALKALLMDQKAVAGLGNIYSDEILHAAGLRYDHVSSRLTPQEVRRLYRSMVEVISEAIKARGSSLADQQYVDLRGAPGSYQMQHQVYAREGQACPRCRGTIERAKFQQRSTFYCPHCQV